MVHWGDYISKSTMKYNRSVCAGFSPSELIQGADFINYLMSRRLKKNPPQGQFEKMGSGRFIKLLYEKKYSIGTDNFPSRCY